MLRLCAVTTTPKLNTRCRGVPAIRARTRTPNGLAHARAGGFPRKSRAGEVAFSVIHHPQPPLERLDRGPRARAQA